MFEYLNRLKDINDFVFYGNKFMTSLHLACLRQNEEAVDYLLERGANVNKSSPSDKNTPLHLVAAHTPNVKITRKLIDNGAELEERNNYQHTPLLHAIRYNNIVQVRELIRLGADLSARDSYGRNALHIVFMEQRHKVNLDLCKLLLELKCDPNLGDPKNLTPLHILAANGLIKNKIECLKLFLKYKADLNIQDSYGDTVLHRAAESEGESLPFIKKVINAGAQTIQFNNENITFIDILEENKINSVYSLIQYYCLRDAFGCFKLDTSFFAEIRTVPEWAKFEEKCRSESNRLVAIKMENGEPFPWGKIYDNPARKIVRSYRYDDVLWSAIEEFVEEDFPIYGTHLMVRFEMILQQLEAENSCYMFLMEVSKGVLRHYSILKILELITKKGFDRIEAIMESRKKISHKQNKS